MATTRGGNESWGAEDGFKEIKKLLKIDLSALVLVDGVEEILHILNSDRISRLQRRGRGRRPLGHFISEETPNDQFQLFEIDVAYETSEVRRDTDEG